MQPIGLMSLKIFPVKTRSQGDTNKGAVLKGFMIGKRAPIVSAIASRNSSIEPLRFFTDTPATEAFKGMLLPGIRKNPRHRTFEISGRIPGTCWPRLRLEVERRHWVRKQTLAECPEWVESCRAARVTLNAPLGAP